MSVLTDTWRGLVQRRLWPIALVLLGALAAVPFVLAEEPAPAPAPATVAGEETELAAQPIVEEASAAEREAGRRVVGTPKDPFKPAPAAKKKGKKASSASVKAGTASPDAPTSVPSGGFPSIPSDTPAFGGGSGGNSLPSLPSLPNVTPVGPAPSTPAPAKPRYEVYSLTVRWGLSSDEARAATNVKRLKALPSNEEPAIIYLGVLEDRKTAVFMVDALVEPVGDGTCKPRPEDCQTLHLRAGETQYFDVLDEDGEVKAQYQLDLVKIHKGATTSKLASAAEAKGGRTLLRARASQAAGYEYDADRGVLDRLGAKAAAAKIARLAKAAGL